ncbi:MAG: hypothetical protein NVSMB26_08160 [Beijerinckiaceae bacterium]
MQERRAVHRNRTYLRGQVVYNDRCSNMDCLVRNMSQNGAKIVFPDTALIPSEFDIMIRQKGESRRARIIWRSEKEAGVTFLHSDRGTIVSIETARRIKRLEQDRETLANRVAQLSEPA